MAIGSAASLEAAAMNKLRWRHVAVPAALMCGAGALVVGSAPVALATAGQAVSRPGRSPGPGPTCCSIRARRPAACPRRAGTPSRSRAGGSPAACRPSCGTARRDSRAPPGAGRPCAAGSCSPAAPAARHGCGSRSRCGRQAGHALPAGTRYRLSAWLGGTAPGAGPPCGDVPVRGRAGARRRAIGSPGRSWRTGGLASRTAAGPLPPRDGQRPGHAGPGHLADRHRRPGRAARGLRPGGRR